MVSLMARSLLTRQKRNLQRKATQSGQGQRGGTRRHRTKT